VLRRRRRGFVRGRLGRLPALARAPTAAERERVIDNLLVRIHFIIVMIKWTGLAPTAAPYRGTSLIRTPPSYDPKVGLYLGPYGGPKGGGCFVILSVVNPLCPYCIAYRWS